MPSPEEAKMIFALQRPSDASPEPVPASQLRSSPGLVIPGANETVETVVERCGTTGWNDEHMQLLENIGEYWK